MIENNNEIRDVIQRSNRSNKSENRMTPQQKN